MSESDIPRKMPKGGRKGGTQFPQLSLKKATEHAKKLVSKTHTGPQPASVVLKGAFESGGSNGRIRAGAMKQYGFLIGTKDSYAASDLAKKLAAAPPEETQTYLRQAFLRPFVYKTLYETFVSDSVSRAKIGQQASALKVYPDSIDKATQLFVEGAVYAGLATADGDNVAVQSIDSVPTSNLAKSIDETLDADEEIDDADVEEEDEGDEEIANPPSDNTDLRRRKGPVRAVANVSFNIDSTTDSEKLAKHLKLLRKYGVI